MIGEIKNQLGETLDYTLHSGGKNDSRIVVLGHGVTGNKDRPFIVALAEGLARAGLDCLRFSFSGNGLSGGRFTESNISKEVEDLGAVLDALATRKVCYVGHSMGAAVGVIRASMDSRIRCLVSLAGMVHTKAFAEREFGSVQPDHGFMWDDTKCPLSSSYMKDMAKIGNVLEKAATIHVPWLLVHGEEDDVVPLQDSLEIFDRAAQPKELVRLPGANHVFAGEHQPLMVAKVVEWIRSEF